MLYTGYYANMKRMPKNSKYHLVVISRTAPDWFYDTFKDVLIEPEFMPINFFEVDGLKAKDFVTQKKFMQRIMLTIENGGADKYNDDKDYIFLCHEKDVKDCHRTLVRKCLNDAGIECKEIYFEKDGTASTAEQLEMEGVL